MPICDASATSLSTVAMPPRVAARVQDGRAMIAQKAVHQEGIARPYAADPKLDAFANDADPRRVDEELVAGPPVDDLGVAGDDRDSGRGRSAGHRAGDVAYRIDVQPPPDDNAAAR